MVTIFKTTTTIMLQNYIMLMYLHNFNMFGIQIILILVLHNRINNTLQFVILQLQILNVLYILCIKYNILLLYYFIIYHIIIIYYYYYKHILILWKHIIYAQII